MNSISPPSPFSMKLLRKASFISKVKEASVDNTTVVESVIWVVQLTNP